ncbi:MAG TPA: sigma-70 family RNA polymerase sigma factor [Anaerolineales bacterium]|nr:sigma-70 family RNA polymerase sigma factor [Anaerolineales bacterium]
MTNKDMKNPLEEKDKDSLAVDQLIDYGQRQGYVTLTDIMDFLPKTESDENLLEDVFEALTDAGIRYEEDEDEESDPGEDLSADEEREGVSHGFRLAGSNMDSIETHDMVRLYLHEATRVPLLSAQEERDLSQRIELGRRAQTELTRRNVPPNRMKELRQLIEDGWEARQHLIRANTRLVISVARKYMGRGLPFLDLVQEGNIGLMRAAKKYDYHRGYKFSTYATWWIRQAITRALADQARTIRLPVHMGDQISRMMREQHRLQQELGRTPTTEELADALDVTKEKVEQMAKVSQFPISLETPVGESDEEVFGDFVEDNDTPDPEEVAAQLLLRRDLDEVLDELPPREMRVLQLRYGLDGGDPMTLKEVGRKMGITRERVRQLESQALARIRSPQSQQKLRAYAEG